MIKFENISNEFKIIELSKNNIDDIYNLSCSNPQFYDYCPPFVTKKSIEDDLKKVPDGKSCDDKYYIGFYQNDDLVAIMDFIINYPNDKTIFIGLFMVDKKYQSKGVGTNIINSFFSWSVLNGFNIIRLGYVEENEQSKKFWIKQGFIPTGIIIKTKYYNIIVIEKKLTEYNK